MWNSLFSDASEVTELRRWEKKYDIKSKAIADSFGCFQRIGIEVVRGGQAFRTIPQEFYTELRSKIVDPADGEIG